MIKVNTLIFGKTYLKYYSYSFLGTFNMYIRSPLNTILSLSYIFASFLNSTFAMQTISYCSSFSFLEKGHLTY